MALTLTSAARTAMVDPLVDLLDVSGPGTIEIRSGTRPAGAGDAATGTLLATVTLLNPAFGAASGGVATLNDPAAVAGVAAGTASWFRAKNGAAATVFDGSVSVTGGGGDLQLATTTISVGLSVDITGGTVTMPAGSAT